MKRARASSLAVAGVVLAGCGYVSPVGSERPVNGGMRVVIDADTANGLDGLYAIVRALVEPSFRVESLSSAQWHGGERVPADTVRKSQRLNEDILRLMGRSSVPHPKGASEPLADREMPQDSRAARWIVAAAHQTPPGTKLTILSLGPMTNTASAILLDPRIVPKIRCYVVGLQYDDRTGVWSRDEFNSDNDIRAADVLLEAAGLELHVMPAITARQLVFHRERVESHLRSKGGIWDYLAKRWDDLSGGKDEWTMPGVALVEALARPDLAFETEVKPPAENASRRVNVYTEIDQARMETSYWRAIADYRRAHPRPLGAVSEPAPSARGRAKRREVRSEDEAIQRRASSSRRSIAPLGPAEARTACRNRLLTAAEHSRAARRIEDTRSRPSPSISARDTMSVAPQSWSFR